MVILYAFKLDLAKYSSKSKSQFLEGNRISLQRTSKFLLYLRKRKAIKSMAGYNVYFEIV